MCMSACISADEEYKSEEAMKECMAKEVLAEHWIWAFFIVMPYLVFFANKFLQKKVSFKRSCLTVLCSFPIYWAIVWGGRTLFPVLLSWIGIVLVALFVFIGFITPFFGVIYGTVVSLKNKKMWHVSWPWIVLPLLVFCGVILAGFFVDYC